jgi:hypothetical protein
VHASLRIGRCCGHRSLQLLHALFVLGTHTARPLAVHRRDTLAGHGQHRVDRRGGLRKDLDLTAPVVTQF